MGREEQEKLITRTIEKALHDHGLTVVSHEEGEDRVIEVEDSKTRTVSEVRISRQKK